MNEKEINDYFELAKTFKCPYLVVCKLEKYNSCHNHSHVLCDDFELLYYKEKNNKKIDDLESDL